MSELDDFFANLPENQDDGSKVTEEHVQKVLGTLEGMIFNLMSGVNIVSLHYVKVHRDGESVETVWIATIAGVPISAPSLVDLAEAVAKMLNPR